MVVVLLLVGYHSSIASIQLEKDMASKWHSLMSFAANHQRFCYLIDSWLKRFDIATQGLSYKMCVCMYVCLLLKDFFLHVSAYSSSLPFDHSCMASIPGIIIVIIYCQRERELRVRFSTNSRMNTHTRPLCQHIFLV